MPFWVDDLFLDLMICYVLVVDVKFVCVLVLPFFCDDWCLMLMLGYVLHGYVKLVCFCFAAVVVDWCLKLSLGYVVIAM